MTDDDDKGGRPDPDNREEDDVNDDDDHSEADSRKSRSKKKKRKRHHRSRSESRSSSRGADFKRVLAEALGPITKKLAELSRENSSEASTSGDLQEIRERQQLLDIETKAATMKTAGAQSQFRCMAGIKRRITNSITALDEFMLSLESPDDPAYMQISGIKEELAKAEEEAAERISLIFKADEDPKVGWSAISMMDKKLGTLGHYSVFICLLHFTML